MKIGRGVSELWGVENRPLPLTWPMAYTTACTTVQAVILVGHPVYPVKIVPEMTYYVLPGGTSNITQLPHITITVPRF